MLAVPLTESEVRPLLDPHLSLSAVNGPRVAVIAGPPEPVTALAAKLSGDGVACRQLPSTHAFHSSMMEPVAEALTDLLAAIPLRPPRIPFVSNVTGTWITAAEATDPSYWAEHLCRTVRFSDGVGEILRQGQILLEVGPGRGLGALVLQHPGPPSASVTSPRVVLPSLRSHFERQDDQAFTLNTLGCLWLAGATVDWTGFYAGEERRRLQF